MLPLWERMVIKSFFMEEDEEYIEYFFNKCIECLNLFYPPRAVAFCSTMCQNKYCGSRKIQRFRAKWPDKLVYYPAFVKTDHKTIKPTLEFLASITKEQQTRIIKNNEYQQHKTGVISF